MKALSGFVGIEEIIPRSRPASKRLAGLSALAVRGVQTAALCGRQSCLQAAFQTAVEQTTHTVRKYFFGFVPRRQRAAQHGKLIAYREGGLKGRFVVDGEDSGRLESVRSRDEQTEAASKRVNRIQRS